MAANALFNIAGIQMISVDVANFLEVIANVRFSC